MQTHIDRAGEYLSLTQLASGSWPYRAGTMQGYPEPTCLALMALENSGLGNILAGVNWLVQQVNEEGKLFLTDDDQPNWGTPQVILVLSKLQTAGPVRQRSLDWLLEWRSNPAEASPFVTLDGSLIGWPWISDTFGWVEPTSQAVIVLKKSGYKSHARVVEAEELLLDRSCAAGGWNVGNPVVLGRALEGFLPPTAQTLLALQDLDMSHPVIQKGLMFLQSELSRIQSALSLAWGILCLDVYDLPVSDFAAMLRVRQEPDGSWRQQIQWTALAMLALQATNGEGNVYQF